MSDDRKPVLLRITGDREKSLRLRKFACKLLDQSKQRNERLGNYANPVSLFSNLETRIKTYSLPGYDIVEIHTPPEGGAETYNSSKLYSGLTDPKYSAASVEHYLRYWPSDYELDTTAASSIDGSTVDPEMPPNRWMYNDYTGTREEAPWFGSAGQDSGFWGSANSPVAGRYSGKLRELVQLQLAAGLSPQFTYTGNNSNGIRLETLDTGIVRIWLYRIGAGGVLMQKLFDYSEKAYEEITGIREGTTPPEIKGAGFFAFSTSFNTARPVYTKAEYDALNPKPSLGSVTFELVSASSYNSTVGNYSALGDYGWSFNSAGTKAVIVGFAWNTVTPGVPAQNYKSQKFVVTFNEYTASIAAHGESPFLFPSNEDQIKVPLANGFLSSVYFWRNQSGGSGTQPSSSYTAPMYAYYDLSGVEQVAEYEYTDPVSETINGNSGVIWNWTETLACRSATAINYEYTGCSTGRSGTGSFGGKHGFTSAVTSTNEEVYDFTGYELDWASPVWFSNWWVNRTQFPKRFAPPPDVTLDCEVGVTMGHHHYVLLDADFTTDASSVLVIPSFERLGYYHYKKYHRAVTGGATTTDSLWYFNGTPTRYWDFGGQIHECAVSSCGAFAYGELATPISGGIYNSDTGTLNLTGLKPDPTEGCIYGGDSYTCFTSVGVDSDDVLELGVPDPINPYTEDNTDYIGGLVLPDGGMVAFSEDEMLNQSDPWRESSALYGYQSVISAFDSFSDKYIFSMPSFHISPIKDNVAGVFPNTDYKQIRASFVGVPFYSE